MAKLKPCPWPGKSKPKICKSPKFPRGYNWQVIWRDSGVQIMTCAFPTRRQAIDARTKEVSMIMKWRNRKNEIR